LAPLTVSSATFKVRPPDRATAMIVFCSAK
jgi:hypothetical protein